MDYESATADKTKKFVNVTHYAITGEKLLSFWTNN